MLHFYTFILFETWIVMSWQCKAKLKNDLVLNDWTIIIYLVLSLEFLWFDQVLIDFFLIHN